MTFALVSPAFAPGGEIPRRYTCQGEDISPPLSWSDAPAGTKSFALIVDDPDAPDPKAPRTTWVHWVLYNLSAETLELPEAMGPETLPPGAEEGQNDWRNLGYGGPCPPVGRHRYFHKLYALDIRLPNLGAVTKSQLELAMGGHILGRAELVGTYQK
jgi:Raf kinase inhibitor-like YbhB/YbcL family protein